MPFCTNCGAQTSGQFCPQCGKAVGPVSTQQDATVPLPPAGLPPAQKGGALKWVLIGCLGVLVLVAVVTTMTGLFVAKKVKDVVGDGTDVKSPAVLAAKIIAAANPDVEVVSADEKTGTVTIRDKKNGKTITVNLEDLKQGKIILSDEEGKQVEIKTKGEGEEGSLEVRTEDGVARFGAGEAKLPSWLPPYPGTTPKSAYSMENANKDAAVVAFTSKESAEKIAAFYEEALKKAGLKVTRSSMGAEGRGVINVHGQGQGVARTANVTITTGDNGESQVNLMYEDQ